jgi:hypothetical protein
MSKSDHEKVLNAVEDRFYEDGLFSNAGDIAEITGIPKSSVRGLIEDLEGTGLTRVYEGSGKPNIYITKQMNNSLTSQVGEPDWISEYEFEEKRELREEVQESNDKIAEYQVIEQLLFGTGVPLEKSAKQALQEMDLGPDGTENDEDILIEVDGHTYVLEVKGVSGQVSKGNINQLGGWLDKKISEGIKADELTGVLLHNHERNTNPEDRGEPLTSHAKEFLKYRNSTHISTVDLYQIVKKRTENGESPADAREKFLELIE